LRFQLNNSTILVISCGAQQRVIRLSIFNVHHSTAKSTRVEQQQAVSESRRRAVAAGVSPALAVHMLNSWVAPNVLVYVPAVSPTAEELAARYAELDAYEQRRQDDGHLSVGDFATPPSEQDRYAPVGGVYRVRLYPTAEQVRTSACVCSTRRVLMFCTTRLQYRLMMQYCAAVHFTYNYCLLYYNAHKKDSHFLRVCSLATSCLRLRGRLTAVLVGRCRTGERSCGRIASIGRASASLSIVTWNHT
jgi:hypothetical protein